MGALRLEVEEEAAAQFGEDDLYKQIGGLNPFGILYPAHLGLICMPVIMSAVNCG